MSGKINYSHSSSPIKSFRTPQRGSREHLCCTANKTVFSESFSALLLCHPGFFAEVGAAGVTQGVEEPWWDQSIVTGGTKTSSLGGTSRPSAGASHPPGGTKASSFGGTSHPPWWDLVAAKCVWSQGLSPFPSHGDKHIKGQHPVPPTQPLVCSSQRATLPAGNEVGRTDRDK